MSYLYNDDDTPFTDTASLLSVFCAPQKKRFNEILREPRWASEHIDIPSVYCLKHTQGGKYSARGSRLITIGLIKDVNGALVWDRGLCVRIRRWKHWKGIKQNCYYGVQTFNIKVLWFMKILFLFARSLALMIISFSQDGVLWAHRWPRGETILAPFVRAWERRTWPTDDDGSQK